MGVLPDDKFALLEKAQKEGTIIGLDKVTGQTVDRLDLDELLFKEPDAFNIFLIALQNLQKDEIWTEKFSFFQVAGIDCASKFVAISANGSVGVHGLPRKLWDNDTGGIKLNVSKPDSAGSGYCHHGHLGFGPWHRPYLAMLEVRKGPEVLLSTDKCSLLPSISKLSSMRWSRLRISFQRTKNRSIVSTLCVS